jgi:hypothetical protein
MRKSHLKDLRLRPLLCSKKIVTTAHPWEVSYGALIKRPDNTLYITKP